MCLNEFLELNFMFQREVVAKIGEINFIFYSGFRAEKDSDLLIRSEMKGVL